MDQHLGYRFRRMMMSEYVYRDYISCSLVEMVNMHLYHDYKVYLRSVKTQFMIPQMKEKAKQAALKVVDDYMGLLNPAKLLAGLF